MAGTDLARYLLGHGLPDIHSAHYVHPERKRRFPEVVAAIYGLEDPIAEAVRAAG